MLHALALAALVASTPADRVETRVRAEISDDLETLDLRVESTLRPAVATASVAVVFAADRYRHPPEDLHPSAVRQHYVGGFDPGGFERVELRVDGQACALSEAPDLGGARRALCRRLGGGPVRVEVSARLRIPRRLGPFGRRGRSVTLAGGWYPYPIVPGRAPPRGRVELALGLPAGVDAVVADRRVRGGAARTAQRVVVDDAAQLPLALRPLGLRSTPLHDGAVRFAHSGPDAGGRRRALLDAVSEGLWFYRREGLPWPRRRPAVLLEAPLRHRLAEAADGLVLVSDRAFRILPLERTRRFHAPPILRALYARLLLGGPIGDLPAGRRELVADAVASWLVDRYVAGRQGRAEDAFDVLDAWSFIPAVDSMLFAPDLAFVAAYFRVVREDDPQAHDWIGFPSRAPPGKQIYDKLLDRLGAAGIEASMRALCEGRALESVIRRALGTEAEAFLDTWLGPYPDVRYGLERWAATPTAGGVRAEAVIRREGAAVAEPITVRFTDVDGGRREVVAPADPAARRTVSATLAAALARVELDPHGRLAEAPTAEQPQPRADNASSRDWRWLLNNFNVLLAATDARIETALDIGLYRTWDERWRFALRGDLGPNAITLSGRGRYGFGRVVMPNRRAQWLGVETSAAYLRPGFAGATEDGAALGARLYYGYDGRRSAWAPETAAAARLTLGYDRRFGADGAGADGSTNAAVGATARGVLQWQLGLAHQLAVKASLAGFLAGTPPRQGRLAIGGRYNVRGYAVDAAVGRFRAIASAEWLHPLVAETSIDGFHLAWVTGIDGAIFGDLAAIADDPAGLVSRRPLADVGYGLRLYLDWFGVRPGVMAIDVAFPLVALPGESRLGPPAIYVDFAQSFLVF